MSKMTTAILGSLFLLLLSAPTAMAGSVDGKGVWCDNPGNEFGYWFENSKAIKHSIKGHMIHIQHLLSDYEEIGTDEISFLYGKLNRKTLVIRAIHESGWDTYQCYLVNSAGALDDVLRDSIARGKAENKL